MKLIFITIIFLLVGHSLTAQYGNKYVLGLSSAGTYRDQIDLNGLYKMSFVLELYPSLGYKIYDSLYLFIEGGTSFSSSKNIEKPFRLWSLGVFTRWYFYKHGSFDLYTGLFSKFNNIEYVEVDERIRTFESKGLTNSVFGIYGGMNVKIYKRLSGSFEYGIRYYETLGIGIHRNLMISFSI